MEKRNVAMAIVMLAAVALSGCSGLSSRAKEMTGDYYLPELTDDVPVMELKGNGTVVQRAIMPGVLSYSVKGRWNVKNDSLIITKLSEPYDVEGDSTLIGKIPERMSKAVVAFNGVTLTLRQGGADYVYFRRGQR